MNIRLVLGILLVLSLSVFAVDDTVPEAPIQSSVSVSLQSLIDAQNAMRGDIQVLRQDLSIYKVQTRDEINTWRYNELAFMGSMNFGFLCIILIMLRLMRYKDVVMYQRRFNDHVSALSELLQSFRSDLAGDHKILIADLALIKAVVNDVKAGQEKALAGQPLTQTVKTEPTAPPSSLIQKIFGFFGVRL
jgi:hypothetical protein